MSVNYIQWQWIKWYSKPKQNNIVSNITYTNTKKFSTHEAGQGTGNGGIKWTFISISMMEVVDEVALECIIQLPSGNRI